MPSEQCIHLIFNPVLRVAGETVDGEIHLNFPSLLREKIEQVYVQLHGFVDTRTTRQVTPNIDSSSHKRIELVNESIRVWTQDDKVYPPAGSEMLKTDFTFKLPKELLPSFECGKRGNQHGRVRYYVQGLGKRPASSWRGDLSIIRPFPVLPSHSAGAELRDSLRQGWVGKWHQYSEEKDIRRGIWGEYSHVKASFTIPKVDALPVLTPIPYTLRIITQSKIMKSHEKDPIALGAIFPTPPTVDQVALWIENDAFIRTENWAAAINGKVVAHLGGLGCSNTSNQGPSTAPVQVDVADKTWVPSEAENDGKGRWKQEAVFKSTFSLNCAPSFDSETINAKYRLKLRAEFAGVGNSLRMEIPVKVVSSMYPLGQRAWDGPPPEIDLPPAYYQTVELDYVEKKK